VTASERPSGEKTVCMGEYLSWTDCVGRVWRASQTTRRRSRWEEVQKTSGWVGLQET
jgi:hypothetical protein